MATLAGQEVELWPHQISGTDEVLQLIESGEQRICLCSPTGGGKTRMMTDLLTWAIERGWRCVLYTNRRLLTDQISRVVSLAGIDHGIRAAGHVHDASFDVQVSRMQTEERRVFKAKLWQLHDAKLVLVDEAHLQKSGTAEKIINQHVEAGAVVVGVTATPLGVGHLYTKIVVAGVTSELRKCGALLPCYTYGPDEPDTRHIKPQATGEYTEADVRKVIMTPSIWGRVYDWWKKLNPDARPTILFAPGVPESQWFAERFAEKGVRSAHIDGKECWVDGEVYQGDRERKQIIADVRSGAIQVVCNRFVLREGIDIPELYHGIFATVFGSLQSYLQSGGRLLRSCEGMDHVILQDHGGNWWRHGSLNADRHWDLAYTANIVNGLREEKFREKREPEPIRCPQCSSIRASGPTCTKCGFAHTKRSRPVIQHDGTLQEMTGDIFKPRRIAMKPDTMKLWQQTYYRAKASRNGMTFRQAEGLFFYENHYWPPRDIPLMPLNELDWYRRVKDVEHGRLST